MKQRDWITELEEADKDDWVVFNQAGRCFGLIMETTYDYILVRCKCDMNETRDATNKVRFKNIKGHYNSFAEAENAHHQYYKR